MTPPGVVSATDQEKLINYLNNGGNLYIESVNIGSDHENTTFFDYFGVELLDDGDEYEVVTLKGGCYNCSESLKFNYLGGNSPHYSCDKLDDNGATLLLNSEDGKGRMYVHETGEYKIIVSSIVAAAIANDDSLSLKPYLFSEFVNYFMGYNPVTKLQENIRGWIAGNIFPNPFKNKTTIQFQTDRPGRIKVEICSMNGSVIATLADGYYKPGKYEIVWDTAKLSGNKPDKGCYISRIISGDQVITQKLILVD